MTHSNLARGLGLVALVASSAVSVPSDGQDGALLSELSLRESDTRLSAAQPGSPGGGPEAMAFDGTSVWVGLQFSNTVARIGARDLAVATPIAVGERPTAIVAEPGGLWVARAWTM